MKTEFKEEQKFPQWLRWLILIGTGIFPVYMLYKQLILDEPIGSNTPMSDITLMILCIVLFAILLLFWSIRLKTEINQDGIKMHYFPLVKKHLKNGKKFLIGTQKEMELREVLKKFNT